MQGCDERPLPVVGVMMKETKKSKSLFGCCPETCDLFQSVVSYPLPGLGPSPEVWDP